MENITVVGGLVAAAIIEGANGLAFTLRSRRTLTKAGLSYDDGPGLLVQEFGVYSIAIALAYVVATFDPDRRHGVILVGISINVAAGAMHLARAFGIYLGDAKPILAAATERNQGLVHAVSVLLLSASFATGGGIA